MRFCEAPTASGSGSHFWTMPTSLPGDDGWRTDKTLPQGFSPGDVAKDVIIKVIEGDRTWDEAKEPNFLNALKGMVRSDIGHLFDDYEASRIEPIERTFPDGSARTATASAETIPAQKRSSCTVSGSDWR